VNAKSILSIVVTGKFIANILRRNCPLKHVPEGKIEETGIRARRCKQLLDDLKEKRRYYNLKQEVFDRSVENLLWKGLWTGRKADYALDDYTVKRVGIRER